MQMDVARSVWNALLPRVGMPCSSWRRGSWLEGHLEVRCVRWLSLIPLTASNIEHSHIALLLTLAAVEEEECGGQQLKWPTLSLQGPYLLAGWGMSARLDRAWALSGPACDLDSHMR